MRIGHQLLRYFAPTRFVRGFGNIIQRRQISHIPPYATVNPDVLSGDNPCKLFNLEGGDWKASADYITIPDPLNGEPFIQMPDTKFDELGPFVTNAKGCPKSGLHNPLKNPERYVMWGEIMHQIGYELSKPATTAFFAKLIQRVMPKHSNQALYEVQVTASFFKNFGGDNPRFNAGGQQVAGDRVGQRCTNWRWPFGPVCIVSPFNFPLEIPTLQLMGALMMGNRPTLKAAPQVSIVMEQLVRLLIHCGMPPSDMDLLHAGGRTTGELIGQNVFRMSQFTGSYEVAETLSQSTRGKVRLEDAGFDWKILGPDSPSPEEFEYVAWQSDQDAYAASGQKCSAQSILFAHDTWSNRGIFDRLADLAANRKLSDLTISPTLSHTTEQILQHTNKLLRIPGACLAFGGKELKGHTVPPCYGAVEPTAVFVPLKELLKPEHFQTCCREIFAPFQVFTEYHDGTEAQVLEACERMSHHLSAAVVSNDPHFQNRVLGATVNGTTYTGMRSRTTGAPQNHWFGPAGDPRGAGIGTPHAIQLVWSCHREIIHDDGAVPKDWTLPQPT